MPCATRCISAVAANGLDVEPVAYSVFSSTGRGFSRFVTPWAANNSVPSCQTATARPGTPNFSATY